MNNLNLNESQGGIIMELFAPIIDSIVDRVSEKILRASACKEPKYYTRKETANILHITLPTLARLTKDGLLSCKRIGSRILYDAESIDDAIEERVVFKYRRSAK